VSNIQAQNMIMKVRDTNIRAILTMCDDGISILYCQGLLAPVQMRKMRDKLIKKIERQLLKEATND